MVHKFNLGRKYHVKILDKKDGGGGRGEGHPPVNADSNWHIDGSKTNHCSREVERCKRAVIFSDSQAALKAISSASIDY